MFAPVMHTSLCRSCMRPWCPGRWATGVYFNRFGGMVPTCHLAAGNADEWDKMLQLNLHTPLRLTRGLAPSMVDKPNHSYIINIDSIAGRQPMPNNAICEQTRHSTGSHMCGWDVLMCALVMQMRLQSLASTASRSPSLRQALPPLRPYALHA